MSIFDKVTKAVGDAVDKGKAEVDEFRKIQKINGEIGELESKIAGLKNQIAAATKAAGEQALGLVKAGTLTSPELKAFVDQIAGFGQDITAQETAIAGKKKDIEAIKAEGDKPKQA